jgi:hypothetical protein
MRRWELWSGDDSNTFFPATSEKTRVMARVEGEVKVWETEASSSNDAMQKRNDYLGYGPYVPMLQDDGTPYPEDEDDDVRKEQEGEFFDAPWPGFCPVVGRPFQVPGQPDPDEVVRTGRLEFQCPACGQTHIWRFGG